MLRFNIFFFFLNAGWFKLGKYRCRNEVVFLLLVQ